MGIVGMMGYATYCPTKFALVGLMEPLRNELKPKGISVSIVYPSDVNTPGFATENITKPPECAIMSKASKLMEPDQVASVIIKGILKKKLYILPGESNILSWIFRHFPWVVHSFLDSSYAKARKQIQKKTL
jgi:3-dehydrosphinganine reductase